MFNDFGPKTERHDRPAVHAADDASGHLMQLTDIAIVPYRLVSETSCNTLDFACNNDIYGNDRTKALTDQMLRNLTTVGVSKETAAKVLDEIRDYGEPPQEVIKALMQKHRVLAIGEAHQNPNPQRDLVGQNMSDLKEAGASHLAVEMPSNLQPILDDFYRTGKVDLQELPNLLQDENYLDMIRAARENGIKIVAVDRSDVAVDGGHKLPSSPDEPWQTRDQIMAGNISKILDENPNNKVVFFVGAQHLNRSNVPGEKLAADYIGESFDIATIKPIYSTSRGTALYPLSEITTGIKKAVAVSTKNAVVLGSLPNSRFNHEDQQYVKDWDYVFIYP